MEDESWIHKSFLSKILSIHPSVDSALLWVIPYVSMFGIYDFRESNKWQIIGTDSMIVVFGESEYPVMGRL
jgi:hypothetical protein